MADITQLQAIVGSADEAQTTAGVSLGVRMSRAGALHNAPAHARFQAAVGRNRCFGVCNQAGITTQAGLSATTPALTLYNPIGSGVNLVVWYAGATFSVAFAAAAAVWAAVNTNTAAAAVTGTATTTHRNLLLGGNATPKAQPLLAATLPAAPVGLNLLGMGLTGAITTIPQIQTIERWYDGALILKENTALSIQTSTASGTSATFLEYLWEEVPS